VIGALAEFERAIIIERTSAGLKAAKARGVQLGRKPSLTPAQVKHARKLIKPAPAKAGGGENPRAVAPHARRQPLDALSQLRKGRRVAAALGVASNFYLRNPRPLIYVRRRKHGDAYA